MSGPALSEDATRVSRIGDSYSSIDLSAIEYCAKNLALPEVEMPVRVNDWASNDYLLNLSPDDFDLEVARDPEVRETIQVDEVAEFHAENFCRMLEQRVEEGSLVLSPEFRKVQAAWRYDEVNHASGFAMLCYVLYGTPVEDRWAEIGADKGNFAPLREAGLLEDEFTIVALLAIDERITADIYATETNALYKRLGNDRVTEWIKAVTRDEIDHYLNFMKILETNHFERLHELTDIVDRYIEYSTQQPRYHGTFVDAYHYSGLELEALQRSCKKMLSHAENIIQRKANQA